MIHIVPAKIEHAVHLGENLRAGDWLELKHMGYTRGQDAAAACIEDCKASVVALEDGLPIAGWGHKPDDMLIASTAYLWCMTTPAVERYKKAILRLSRDFVADLQLRFERLESTVSPIYPEAMRWTKWLGFKPAPGESTVVLNGVEFINIVRVKGA